MSRGPHDPTAMKPAATWRRADSRVDPPQHHGETALQVALIVFVFALPVPVVAWMLWRLVEVGWFALGVLVVGPVLTIIIIAGGWCMARIYLEGRAHQRAGTQLMRTHLASERVEAARYEVEVSPRIGPLERPGDHP